jgi:hypothetical protein
MRSTRAIGGDRWRHCLKLCALTYGKVLASAVLHRRGDTTLPLRRGAHRMALAHTVRGLRLCHHLPLVCRAHCQRGAYAIRMIASRARFPFGPQITYSVRGAVAVVLKTSRLCFPLGRTALRMVCADTIRVRACQGRGPLFVSTCGMRSAFAVPVHVRSTGLPLLISAHCVILAFTVMVCSSS